MINQGNDVPENTLVVFNSIYSKASKESLDFLIHKPERKRDWFSPHFYKCLPLSIGNQYGFIVKSPVTMYAAWNGGNNPEDLSIIVLDGENGSSKPLFESHFGHGILTFNPPFTLRTPPGVNLMTINPPNYIIPNITVMTGVVETDNLRRNFTFNLKMQMPGMQVLIPKGTPIAGILPVPRYYPDGFDIKFAEDIFDEETINEENLAGIDADKYRENVEPDLPGGVGRSYFTGKDVYGNEFPDHQLP